MQEFSLEELTGRVRSHVVEVEDPRCTLHRAVVAPFLALRAAASEAGMELAPTSTFRDFSQQLRIWNDKFRGARPLLDQDSRPLDPRAMSAEQIVDAILRWSALPGASRHHWGTEIDVIDRKALREGQRPQLVPAAFAAGGAFARLGTWLSQHCEQYGFYRPYDVDRGGVLPEPWHLSYAPISSRALAQLTLDALARTLSSAAIDGAAVINARLPEIYQRYVLAVAPPGMAALAGINPAARPS
ncbi:MAG: M15 family metallopeptidase [Steroidobacterales bacterium]